VNGAATPIGPIGFNGVGALDFAPNGTLFGVGFDSGANQPVLITVNPATGVGTEIGDLGAVATAVHIADIAFRPSDGTLFATDGFAKVYTINTSTGAATFLGTCCGFDHGDALAFSGTTLYYAANNGGPTAQLFTVNQSTGAGTPVITLTFGAGFVGSDPRPNGMKFDPATGTLFASIVTGSPGTAHYLGTINITTGAVTDLGTTVAGLDAIAIGPAQTGPPPYLLWFFFSDGGGSGTIIRP